MKYKVAELRLITSVRQTPYCSYVSNPLLIEIEPDNQVAVILGQSQTILCKAAVPIHFCRFVIPGEPTLVLRENLPSDNVINYYGTGFANGQCGIKISSIQDKHDGEVTCYLTPETGQTESSNKVRLIVAKPPSYPVLRLDRNNGVYKAGGKMEISCMAYEGRPPANVSLYLDNEQIGYDERPMILGRTVDVANPSMLNASRSVTPEDNGKTLRCVASHIALEAPIETSKQIEVYFKPQPQQPIERFGFSIGRRGEINVTVHANPKPDFIWNVGDLKIPASKYDSNNRLQTSSPFDLGRGYWSVVLTIDSVQKSDFENVYTLEAINVEGKQIYKIRLSSSSEPPAGALSRFNQFYGKISEHMHALGVDMDAGSIIGIVLGVLVLTLAVFLVIFARITGRWCFTARRRSDEEAAGGAGAGSEAHITPGSDEDDEQDQHIISDEKLPPSQHGQENPIHASNEYVNGRNDIIKKDLEKKTDTPV
ncbi:hypothetical protein TKK_0015200 [Trichogramma kaykai]|uniref:Ig-like domain-containing protein n=1 Tax=Trichogramma kaykai TaxID=54128 RepID=A0ABD2WC94_9HYME